MDSEDACSGSSGRLQTLGRMWWDILGPIGTVIIVFALSVILIEAIRWLLDRRPLAAAAGFSSAAIAAHDGLVIIEDGPADLIMEARTSTRWQTAGGS